MEKFTQRWYVKTQVFFNDVVLPNKQSLFLFVTGHGVHLSTRSLPFAFCCSPGSKIRCL